MTLSDTKRLTLAKAAFIGVSALNVAALVGLPVIIFKSVPVVCTPHVPNYLAWSPLWIAIVGLCLMVGTEALYCLFKPSASRWWLAFRSLPFILLAVIVICFALALLQEARIT